MLRLLGVVLFWVLVAPVVHAQNAGQTCKLGETTRLFIAKDGNQASAKLKRGTEVILKDDHGGRWMVETAQGKLGFIKDSWLKQICRFSTPQVTGSHSQRKPNEPIDAGSIAEAAAAMEVSRLAAENPNTVGGEVIQSQAEVIQKARRARADSRASECGETSGKETYRVAVYDLELVNIPEGMGKIITASLLTEVRKLEGASVIGMAEISEMISFEAQRQAIGCDVDEVCLAEIAGALGVDEIITGRLSEESDGRTFLMRRINQRRAEVVKTVNKRLAIGDGQEFLLAIGPAVEELYPKRPNRPGTKRGVAEKVLLRLNPPPIAPVGTLTTIGVSVVGLVVGGTFALLGQDEVNNYNNGAGQENGFYTGDSLAVFNDSQDKAESYVMIGSIGLIAGGALALTSTVMSFFTDWAMLGEGKDDDK
jgi:hypothetical protein